MSTTVLYGIWILFPVIFFGFALWGKLEQMSKSAKKQNPGDFARQGMFLCGCVVACIVIDKFILPSVADLLPDFIPFAFLQVMLFPFVALLGAKLFGGSKPIQIERGGHRPRKR